LHERSPKTFINQFPYENLISVKDMLAVVSRRVKESNKWLPITFNLDLELPKFCAYFRQRENEELDNHWILKPWLLARSIDMPITNNLNQIIRCQETGPKVF
jgi:tubulin--tyrosine ligase-like protein 12